MNLLYPVLGVLLLLSLVLFHGSVFLVLLVVLVFLSWRAASRRTAIREKLGIQGTFMEDFMLHLCCPICSNAQEMREAKVTHQPRYDFCCGEEAEEAQNKHELLVSIDDEEMGVPEGTFIDRNEKGEMEISLNSPSTATATTGPVYFMYGNGEDTSEMGRALVSSDSFKAHFDILSKTSKFIFWSSVSIFLLLSLIFLANGKGYQVMVLILIFLQPAIVLYYLYWKPFRTQASLDLVVKLFSVGFWWSTAASAVLEMVLQAVLFGFLYQVSGVNLPDNMEDDGSESSSTDTSEDDGSEAMKDFMRDHVGIAIIGVFLVAFVVAAGVEETMKHFAVRCCPFPKALTDPRQVLVYLVAAALGFATSENLGYVLGMKQAVIPGASQFENEVLLLLLRVLMPIHVICACIQAVQLNKKLMDPEYRSMSLPSLLLPAIVLHGTFDFVVMLLGLFQYIYDVNGLGFDVLSLVLGLVITIVSAIIVYRQSQAYLGDYNERWMILQDQEM